MNWLSDFNTQQRFRKYISLLPFLLLLSTFLAAQAPQGVNYQAVARDGSGNVIQNEPVDVRLTVLDGNNNTLFTETHQDTTNQYGLFNLVIGSVNTADFQAIDWSSGTRQLKVEIDRGNGWADMGTSDLNSVPYSLYAEEAASADMAIEDLTNVSVGAGNGQVLKWNGSSWVPADDQNADYDSDSTNELQTLSINNDTVFLDNGGHIVLPASNNSVMTGATIDGDGSAGSNLNLAQQGASNGQVLKWNGSSWVPENDSMAQGGGAGAFSTTNNVTSNAPGNYLDDDFVFGSPQLDSTSNPSHNSRMFFDTDKGAFRAGNVTSEQWNNSNRGNHSFAAGFNTTASGSFAMAVGSESVASGEMAFAVGDSSVASGERSFAYGKKSIASGRMAFAGGEGSVASGTRSFVYGGESVANSRGGIALGFLVKSYGTNAFSVGMLNEAHHSFSNVIGWRNKAKGQHTTVIGHENEVGNSVVDRNSYVIGVKDSTYSENTFVLGRDNYVLPHNVYMVGRGNRANNTARHGLVFGFNDTLADNNAIAIGYDNRVNAEYSMVMGTDNLAKGRYSVAIGNNVQAGYSSVDYGAIAMGRESRVSAPDAMAFGKNSLAAGAHSFAAGQNNKAGNNNQTWAVAIGGYDTAAYDKSIAIGYHNISSSNKAVTMGSENSATNEAAIAIGEGNTAVGEHALALGYNNRAGSFWTDKAAIAIGRYDTALETGGIAMGYNALSSANYATAIGRSVEATNNYAFAYGYKSEASGYGSIAMGFQDTATGNEAVAMGFDNVATGNYSSAPGGEKNLASGNYSFANGYQNTASGKGSVAMGYQDKASGNYAVAIGSNTQSSGLASVAMGNGSIASEWTSTAIGHSAQSYADYSTAIGFAPIANGVHSMALGQTVEVSGENAYVFGHAVHNPNDESFMVSWEADSIRPAFYVDQYGVGIGADSRFSGLPGTASKLEISDNDSTADRGIHAVTHGISLFLPGHLTSGNNITLSGDFLASSGADVVSGTSGQATGAGPNQTEFEYGVIGNATGNAVYSVGVYGHVPSADSFAYGVRGITFGDDAYGIYGGNTAPGGYAGYFAGDVTITGNFTNPSDRKLKEDVTEYSGALDKLEQLKTYTYRFKDNEYMALPEDLQYGFIAQEMEAIFPELVKEEVQAVDLEFADENAPGKIEYKSLEMLGMIPVLTQAIKEQQQIIGEKDQKIEALQEQLNAFEDELHQVQAKLDKVDKLEALLKEQKGGKLTSSVE